MQKQNVAILLAASERGRLSWTEVQVRLAAIDLIWGCLLAGTARRRKIQGSTGNQIGEMLFLLMVWEKLLKLSFCN